MTEDEAAKCLLVAQEAIKNNDFQKALRFLDKSLRIKETQKAIYLRGQVQKKINGEDVQFEDAKSNHSSSATAASSANNSKQSSHKEEEKTQNFQYSFINLQKCYQFFIISFKTEETPNYTQEDVKRCKEIIVKKCYYEILCVEKSADENHIKKAYRKLALKFHPDKNRAPQATDAFKKCYIIQNPEKRRMYDQHGTEENFQQQYRQQYQEEFDPDDIFRMFFGGNIYTSSFGHGRRHHNPLGKRKLDHQKSKYEYLIIQKLAGLSPSIKFRTALNNNNNNLRNLKNRDEDETGQNQPRQQQSPGLQLIFQMAPLIFFFLLTFVSNIDNFSSGTHDEAKRAKAHYNNLARRYRSTHDYYEVYINKAESVDLSWCDSTKEFRRKLRQYT